MLCLGPEPVLVDSGYVAHAAMTDALVGRLLEGRPLVRLLNTHLHSDHCGGNATMQRRYPGLHTSVPAGALAAVREWDEDHLTFRATAQRCERFAVDGALTDGDRLAMGGLAWDVIASPGHDPQSVMLHCRSHGLLISADALWQDGFGIIFPELVGAGGFDDQRATLARIASLDVRLVMPGHGRIFDDVAGALGRAQRRLDYLAQNPERHAASALRVLVKFLLLEQQRIAPDALVALVAETPLLVQANARFMRLPPEQLAAQLRDGLVKAGAATIDAAGNLVDASPAETH